MAVAVVLVIMNHTVDFHQGSCLGCLCGSYATVHMLVTLYLYNYYLHFY